MNNFKKDEPNNQNHSNQVTISVPPYGGIRRIRPKPLLTMASDANSPWAHLTPSTPSHLVYKSLCPTPVLFCPQDHCKMEKKPHPCKPPSSSPRSYITSSEAITAPPPSNDNTKLFLTTRLLPSLQFLRKLLKNSPRYIQSSSSPLPHHPQFTSVIHRWFGSDYGACTIH